MLNNRKNSGSSDNSHGLDDTPSNGKSDKDDKILLQKKMKALKDAYVKERDSKQNLEKQLNEIKKKIDSLDLLNAEKEEKILKLQSEVSSLEEKLRAEQQKTEALKTQLKSINHSSSTSNLGGYNGASNLNNFGGFFDTIMGVKKTNTPSMMTSSSTASTALSEDYAKLKNDHAKLMEEYNFLRKQNDSQVEKLTRAEGEKEIVKREYKQQIDDLRKKLADTEKIVENQRQEIGFLTQNKAILMKSNEELYNNKTKLEESLEILQKKFDAIETERNQLFTADQEKLQLLHDLNDTCTKMETQLKEISEQKSEIEIEFNHVKEELTKNSEELLRIESQLQIFSLKRLTKMTEFPIQLLLRKNVNDEHVIEIETNAERIVIPPANVNQFYQNKDTEDTFTFSYRHKGNHLETDVFKSKDTKKILKTLKAFIKASKEQNRTTKPNETKEKKNLISDVISFFGS